MLMQPSGSFGVWMWACQRAGEQSSWQTDNKPRLAALDLMIEAEHGPDSAALLVTHEVGAESGGYVPALLPKLPAENHSYIETVLRYGGIVSRKLEINPLTIMPDT